MTEIKARGILTEVQGINCRDIDCSLRSDFKEDSLCQPKVVLDNGWLKTASERKEVRRDYGSQIPDNCTLGYDKF